jgi:hypothetical protein
MQAIQTRPSISEDDLIDLAAKVELTNTPFIDGKILSSLIKVVFHCGLKKSDLLELNIGDIVDKKGDIRQSIYGCIPVTDEVNVIFRDYIDYLKTRGYSRIKSAPLFPTRNKGRYESRQLQYHLGKCIRGLREEIGLEKIRQSGICRFYEKMLVEGRSVSECLQETTQFSRCTLRHVEGILKNRIIPAGKKKDPFMEHYKIIEKIESDNKLIDENIPIYKAQIENDPKLTVKQRSLLVKELQRVSDKPDPQHQ